jgi:hypothetical protein
VTGPGRLGPAQPTWAELGPAQKIESVEIKILHVLEKKCIFINLFNDIRMKNKKKYIDFFLATNFY